MAHRRTTTLKLLALAAGWLLSGAVWAESVVETIREPAPGEKERRNSRPVRPADPLPDLTPVDLKLQVGERLVYDIRLNGLPAGKAQMDVARQLPRPDGPEVWIVALDIRSNRAISLLFHEIKNKARSNIDVKSGFSRYFDIRRHEGNIETQEKISFCYDIGNMEATYERPRSDGQWRTHRIPLTGKALDPLAAIYYLRSVDLSKLKSVQLPICTDRRVWNTKVSVVETHAPDLTENFGGLKDRRFVVVEPLAEFKGLFERKGNMRVWLDLQTGIPLKMEVETPIGKAEVVISEHQNSPFDR